MLKENSSEKTTNLVPVKCKLNFIANNTAEVPLRNHSMVMGAIFGLIAQVDPIFSYKLHKSTTVKPWSFSLLKFYEHPVNSLREGYSLVKRGTRGFFFIKSVYRKLQEILVQFSMRRKILHIGKLRINIEKITTENKNLKDTPPNIDTITVRLESPTFFYDNRTKIQEQLSSETFLKYQCEKFKQLEILNIEPEQLFPYMWVLKDKTQESWGYITKSRNKNETIGFKGQVGEVIFKIVGNPLERSIIFKILALSEFTGIGTRTSMGFGHNTLKNFTYE